MMVEPAQSTPDNRVWHVTARDGKLGPLSLAGMAELAAAGKINPHSLAWKVGMPGWRPCGTIPELALIILRPPQRSWVWVTELRAISAKLRGIRFNRRPLAVAGLLIMAAAGLWGWRTYLHSPREDDLIGLFAAENSGVWEETAKVEKHENAYVLSEKRGGKWSRSEPMAPMNGKALGELFGEAWREVNPAGLVNATGQMAIVRVPAGWRTDTFICATGYFLMKPSGPVEIRKTETKVLALPSLAPGDSPATAATPEKQPAPEDNGAVAGQTQPQAWVEAAPEPILSAKDTKSESSLPPVAVASATPVPAASASAKPAGVMPEPAKKDFSGDLAAARRRADEARANLARLDVPTKKSLRDGFLRDGDSLLQTSREREAEGDPESALFYAGRARDTFRQCERSLQNSER